MKRLTIDYGIDLGTTNSSIALLEGIEAKVVRNNEDGEITPSVVMIDKKDRLIVGRTAYEKKELDPTNVHGEFKLQMGTDHEYKFERSAKKMKPEELSSEVLKELKAAVMQKKGEDLRAAVISVPAIFELPQCEATRKAAELAGLVVSPLVQEPVAAAMAYGFQDASDKVFWLVYDFGGGTFDAALIQIRDGIIQVVNHGGDNHLGGKILDWKIVDELLVPAIQAEYGPEDFRRGNEKWLSVFARLKYAAEEAKIRLSRYKSADIEIQNLHLDSTGSPVEFEFELKRSDIEKLIEPLVVRSIDICRKVIAEKRMSEGDIDKVILVGGPTLMPYLRKRLEDKKEGLGIPLEFRINPLTVVAQGAAIFAGTQMLEGLPDEADESSDFIIELEYKPVGPDVEPLIGGRVISNSATDLSVYTLEFSNEASTPPWRSGKIGLAKNGVFTTELWAEKGKKNIYHIELLDSEGTKAEVTPDQISYTVGQAITDPPLIHSIGVALANSEVVWFFKKGIPLPSTKLEVLHTTASLRKGEGGGLIRIPVVEGDNPRANRNSLIGSIEVLADNVERELPVGSEVEVKLKIDESRIVSGEAYIPFLDHSVDFEADLKLVGSDKSKLADDFEREKERLDAAQEKAKQTGGSKAKEILERVENQNMVHEVENSIDADDRDSRDKAERRLRDLKIALDELEDELEAPLLHAEAKDQIERTRDVIAKYGKPDDQSKFDVLEKETKQAIKSGDPDTIRRKIDELSSLGMRVLAEHPDFWLMLLSHCEKQRPIMRDLALADDLFAQAYRARDRGELTGLQAAIRQLMSLLPIEEQLSVEAYGSTVMRFGQGK